MCVCVCVWVSIFLHCVVVVSCFIFWVYEVDDQTKASSLPILCTIFCLEWKNLRNVWEPKQASFFPVLNTERFEARFINILYSCWISFYFLLIMVFIFTSIIIKKAKKRVFLVVDAVILFFMLEEWPFGYTDHWVKYLFPHLLFLYH